MFKTTIAVALTAPLLAGAAIAADGGSHEPIRIALSGAQEDPTVITGGRGTAVLRINGNTISYRVRYRNLESDIEQAHIHIGAADTPREDCRVPVQRSGQRRPRGRRRAQPLPESSRG